MMFHDTIEYPGELLIDGPLEGVLYEYAGSWYLDGIVNFTEPLSAHMLMRYREDWHAQAIAKIGEQFCCANVCGHDDVALIRTSHGGRRLWIFYFDRDSSDCMLGWVANTAANRASLMAWLRALADENFANYASPGESTPAGGPMIEIPKIPQCVQW